VDAAPFARAGEVLQRALHDVLARRPQARLAIPGGSALDAAPAARTALGEDWHRVALTWTDERCVPVGDPASNRGAATRLGLLGAEGTASGDPGPAFALPLYEAGETPDAAVARASAGFAAHFSNGLDVVLLGMGSDGHVASLFPSRPDAAPGWVVHVADAPKPPPDRISLTRAALATAACVVLVAAGESKRPAIERLLAGDARLPAAGLEGLVVVTDLDAIEAEEDADAGNRV